QAVIGVPYDIPTPGWGSETVNYLRLYVARPSTEFDIKIFNQGDYFMAVEQKIATEKISKILYPADTVTSGKELRLTQEYFLVACAIRDIMREYLKDHQGFTMFPDKVAIQLNDTHPSLAIAELMRILIDEYWLEWDDAWDITSKTVAYTNHTLLPEALETWSVGLLEHVLPRHLQIIYEINRRFLDRVVKIWPGDIDRMNRMSLIQEGGEKMARMANLSIVGSHHINGVSRLHSDLVKDALVPDFYEMWPEKFTNVTNGITPRRWLGRSNPGLCALISENISGNFQADLDQLKKLEPLADDPAFCEQYLRVRRDNKERLGKIIFETAMVTVDPDSIFDMQAKRIHEYKRQLLNILAVMAEYILLVEDGIEPPAPKTAIFAGKAAPGYQTAKDIIKLIHSVGDVINRDKRTKGLLKVAFLPDYRVTLAEKMVCAADLSQQISTAGYEASGTGNMKFALNGAITIGTLDGANIEISEEVGLENIYIFGLTTPEIAKISEEGSYRPTALYHADPVLRRALDAVRDGRFSPSEPALFNWICPYLLSDRDKYFHLADFASYMAARKKAGTDYTDRLLWGKLGILNTSRMGFFSSDRAIRQYAKHIWNIAPVPA
ncbi:MAG: glycogen/starch/alpha-glucan family phosphorylase, partial [Bacteroidetes bacterium]|nr:glycogen/starch/alpha-glucan family phosphorylase [Bacteroidota bacterium]